MQSLTRISKGLLVGLFAAGASVGLGGCGPDYAIFKVHVASTTTPRNDIEECRMTVTDESGDVILDHFQLEKVVGSNGSELTLKYGCAGGLTNADIGYFSFSTSRSSGTLTFQVDGVNSNGVAVQTGKASGDVRPYPPEVEVNVAISKP
jgi:hypothetical protein